MTGSLVIKKEIFILSSMPAALVTICAIQTVIRLNNYCH
ncbi:hypothetical protein SALWKB2_2225 [Snodgrassella alvi wkB2]|nr:hypothetical protein SALWKB2_2225 [Snodgrassella alvi wkB2]